MFSTHCLYFNFQSSTGTKLIPERRKRKKAVAPKQLASLDILHQHTTDKLQALQTQDRKSIYNFTVCQKWHNNSGFQRTSLFAVWIFDAWCHLAPTAFWRIGHSTNMYYFPKQYLKQVPVRIILCKISSFSNQTLALVRIFTIVDDLS